jgi:hypothetical protein
LKQIRCHALIFQRGENKPVDLQGKVMRSADEDQQTILLGRLCGPDDDGKPAPLLRNHFRRGSQLDTAGCTKNLDG